MQGVVGRESVNSPADEECNEGLAAVSAPETSFEHRGKYRSCLLCFGLFMWTLVTVLITSGITMSHSNSTDGNPIDDGHHPSDATIPPILPATTAPTPPPKTPFRTVQIGVNDFHFGSDDKFQDFLRREAHDMHGIQTVLVEPNPIVFKRLEDETHLVFGEEFPTHVQLLRGAVCPTHGNITFWVVSKQYAIDFPNAPHFQKYELSSIDKEMILRHGIPQEYVLHIDVVCYSPTDLLAAANFTPESVDILTVDAAGSDSAIVSAFLDLPSFSPEVIKFQCNRFKGGCQGDEALGVQHRLDGKGYSTYATEDGAKGGTIWALSYNFIWYKRLIRSGAVEELAHSDQDYVATFHDIGCPNNDFLPGSLTYWKTQSDSGLSDMYSYCVAVKKGTSDHHVIETCCGNLKCHPVACIRLHEIRKAR